VAEIVKGFVKGKAEIHSFESEEDRYVFLAR